MEEAITVLHNTRQMQRKDKRDKQIRKKEMDTEGVCMSVSFVFSIMDLNRY